MNLLFLYQSLLLLFSKNQIFLTVQKNTKRKRFRRTASCLNQNMISRTGTLLFGIVFVLYCCFVQCIQLESGPIRNLFLFSDLFFWFKFSYRFFMFHCIIFDIFPQVLCSFKLQLLFHIKLSFLLVEKRFCVYFV